MTTVLEDIRARLHAINQTISGVKSRAAYDTNIEQLAPVIVPVLGAMTRNVNVIGSEHAEEVRTYDLLLIVGAWNEALPSVSVQGVADRLVPLVHEAYLTRPRLELNGTALDYVKSVKVNGDSGLTAIGDYAAVRIPLTITYTTSYSLNGG